MPEALAYHPRHRESVIARYRTPVAVAKPCVHGFYQDLMLFWRRQLDFLDGQLVVLPAYCGFHFHTLTPSLKSLSVLVSAEIRSRLISVRCTHTELILFLVKAGRTLSSCRTLDLMISLHELAHIILSADRSFTFYRGVFRYHPTSHDQTRNLSRCRYADVTQRGLPSCPRDHEAGISPAGASLSSLAASDRLRARVCRLKRREQKP